MNLSIRRFDIFFVMIALSILKGEAAFLFVKEIAAVIMQECIYICLCQTGTRVAKVIQFFTKNPYNHASVTSDPTCSVMYSFCRSYKHSPLPATFNHEVIGSGVLGMYDEIPCEIYEIPLSAEQKQRFEQMIRHFQENRSSYSYSLIGMWTVLLQIGLERKRKFVCSQFVAHVLRESGVELSKSESLYRPDDLRYLPNARLVYRGDLNHYQEVCNHPSYQRQGA